MGDCEARLLYTLNVRISNRGKTVFLANKHKKCKMVYNYAYDINLLKMNCYAFVNIVGKTGFVCKNFLC